MKLSPEFFAILFPLLLIYVFFIIHIAANQFSKDSQNYDKTVIRDSLVAAISLDTWAFMDFQTRTYLFDSASEFKSLSYNPNIPLIVGIFIFSTHLIMLIYTSRKRSAFKFDHLNSEILRKIIVLYISFAILTTNLTTISALWFRAIGGSLR